MSKQITSQVLGQLTQGGNFEDWWTIDNVSVPFFDNKHLSFTFMDVDPVADTTFIDEADKALRNFLNLTIEDRNLYSDIVYKNRTDTLDELGYDNINPDLANLKDTNGIWYFVNRQAFTYQGDTDEIWIFILLFHVVVTGKKNTAYNWYLNKVKS